MSADEERYDGDTGTVWVYYEFDDPETLIPNDEFRSWIEVLNRGTTDDGREVEAINYVFEDRRAAEYNAQALSYANFGIYAGTIDDCDELEVEGPDFSTQEDFGIE